MASQKVTWKGSKLAHIFDDGWTTGTYRRKYKGQVNGNSDPHWVFYYNSGKCDYVHSLLLKEYGATGSWVIIKKQQR